MQLTLILPPDVAAELQRIADELPGSPNAVAITAIREFCENWQKDERYLLGEKEE